MIQAEQMQRPAAAPIAQPQHSSSDSAPFPLKTLISAVVAAAFVVFGAWIAGFMGAMIGLAAGGGLIGAGYLITNTNKEPDIDSICRGEPLLADDSILWIMGTESAHLANILALCRKERSEDPQAPAAYFSDKFVDELAFVPALKRMTDVRKRSPDLATRPLLEAIKIFDLKKELKQACLLPGEILPVSRTTLHEYLNQYIRDLCSTIGSLAQRLSIQQKKDLNAHLRRETMPIFASKETLLAHLTRCPLFDAKMQTYYLELGRDASWQTDPELAGVDMDDYVNAVDEIRYLFKKKPIEFNTVEQDLVNHLCPLIFASTTVEGQEALNPSESDGRMHLDKDPDQLFLGSDLQIIYTTAPNIKRVRAAVESFGVEVRDLKHLTKPQ